MSRYSHCFPDAFDPDEEPEEYLRQLAEDSNELSRDPEFKSWLAKMEREIDEEEGF